MWDVPTVAIVDIYVDVVKSDESMYRYWLRYRCFWWILRVQVHIFLGYSVDHRVVHPECTVTPGTERVIHPFQYHPLTLNTTISEPSAKLCILARKVTMVPAVRRRLLPAMVHVSVTYLT